MDPRKEQMEHFARRVVAALGGRIVDAGLFRRAVLQRCQGTHRQQRRWRWTQCFTGPERPPFASLAELVTELTRSPGTNGIRGRGAQVRCHVGCRQPC
mmetsp:Transcript_63623/g.204995  ORF Transcript_63623/g.204995 Transcript_63623/m.204995 type:complete len:98 (+) Transcript_63623:666-959(+)